jgi:dolichol-phosphate mannosyltransferase
MGNFNAFYMGENRISVVIPCYRVTSHILTVISGIGKEVSNIYVVDDNCPDNSGDHVGKHTNDPRVKILKHEVNQGVALQSRMAHKLLLKLTETGRWIQV